MSTTRHPGESSVLLRLTAGNHCPDFKVIRVANEWLAILDLDRTAISKALTFPVPLAVLANADSPASNLDSFRLAFDHHRLLCF
jgi:hypothetical protein